MDNDMYNIDKGDKLMWDAPLPFEGFEAKQTVDLSKVIYPVTVIKYIQKHKLVNIKFPSNGTKWFSISNPYLRFPTEKELKTLIWPELQSTET